MPEPTLPRPMTPILTSFIFIYDSDMATSRRQALLGRRRCGFSCGHRGERNPPNADDPSDRRLPNGKLQTDEILKSDYDQNVKDARDLTGLAKSIELDFDKNDQNVLSLGLLKKLDDVEKITKRIRGRIKK